MRTLASLIFVLVAYKPTKAETEVCQTFKDNSTSYITLICLNFVILSNEKLTIRRTDLYCIIFKNSSIPRINTDVFGSQQSLRDLRIIDSKLCVVKKGEVPFNDKLEILRLDGNCISEITDGLLNNLSQLKVLDLSRNNISVIQNSSFDGLTALESLIIFSNKLSVVADTTFSSLSALRSLDISRNLISAISKDAFGKLGYLEKVIASNNLLENINFLLKTANSINYLDVSFNKLPKITSVFKRCEKLEYLDLSQNEISVLETDSFVGLSRLKFLNLNKNKLKELCQSCFLYLVAVKNLYLSYNSLSEVNFISFVDLENLETITLDFNRISKTFSNFLLKIRFAKVTSITLNYNAWKCNELENVVTILAKKNISFVNNYGLLINETNIYGIPCTNGYSTQDSFVNITKERITKESSTEYTPILLILVAFNCILLLTHLVFKVLRRFCKKRTIPVKTNDANQLVNRDYEVINDLYNIR